MQILEQTKLLGVGGTVGVSAFLVCYLRGEAIAGSTTGVDGPPLDAVMLELPCCCCEPRLLRPMVGRHNGAPSLLLVSVGLVRTPELLPNPLVDPRPECTSGRNLSGCAGEYPESVGATMDAVGPSNDGSPSPRKRCFRFGIMCRPCAMT